jgi:hypothetical protein
MCRAHLGDEGGGVDKPSTSQEPEMIYTHEVALMRLAELRHQAEAQRRAREFTGNGGRRARKRREAAKSRSESQGRRRNRRKAHKGWSTAA